MKEEEEEEEEEEVRRRKVTVGRAGICRIWKHEVDTCYYILGLVFPANKLCKMYSACRLFLQICM